MLKFFIYKYFISFDFKYIHNLVFQNKKKTTFFFYNKKKIYLNNSNIILHGSYQNWSYFFYRIYGLNKKSLYYILNFFGYNKNILFTNTDEFFFICFKYLFKLMFDYFSLNWYLIYLKQRDLLLPLLYKGIRFLKKYPCRGQRTNSNYRTSKKRKNINSYSNFYKKLDNVLLNAKYPSWKNIETFYFHRY